MALRIVPRLGEADVPRLTPLVAEYSAALMHGAPAAIDEAYVAGLLGDRVVEIAGAEFEGELVGFGLYYDLPEAISAKRAGQLDDLYVRPSARGRGVAAALVRHIVEAGAARDWVHMRWMAPEGSPAITLYERIAEPAPWRSFVIRIDRSVDW
jgi:GNAT superfamily N-acetyltransferase